MFTPEVAQGVVVGDRNVGAELLVHLPCAGCHGVTAEGQFGPGLAGTHATSKGTPSSGSSYQMGTDKTPRMPEGGWSSEHLIGWIS